MSYVDAVRPLAVREEGTGALFMPDWWSRQLPPYVFLILGVISISAAMVFTRTGKVWVRFNGRVYRAKEPRAFWGEVAAYYFVGVCFIFVYLVI